MISRRSILKAGLWGAAGAQLGCWPGGPSERTPRNALFVVFDAGSARHFGAWGYARPTTPNIDALARAGWTFRRAFSQAAGTVPSVPSYLAGRYPAELHGPTLRADFTLAEAFRAGGFATALFSENPYITPVFGYDQGFDAAVAYFSHEALQATRGTRVDVELDSEKLHADVRAWIGSRGGSPWFAYVHHLRPHVPYVAPAPFIQRFAGSGRPPGRATGASWVVHRLEQTATAEELEYLTALYDGNLAYADHLVGGLVEWLDDTGRLEDTLIVVAADHGEAFMEHGRLQHGTTVYDEMIHVPLVFRFPSRSEVPPSESHALVEMVDVFPTLAEIFGLPTPDGLDGRSLVGSITSPGGELKTHAFSLSPRLRHRSLCIRSARRKLILNLGFPQPAITSRETYDLVADPAEQENLHAGDETDSRLEGLLAARFPRLLDASTPAAPETLDDGVDRETRDALEALGYLSPSE